jgi:plasmid stabilization system protein ParE
MEYNVVISELAQEQYNNILDYICNTLQNPQAVKSIIKHQKSNRTRQS